MSSLLQELQGAIAATAERVGPAVVGLGRGWGRGSGVIVAPGQVLTNAHVLRGDEVAVTFADGEMAHGRVAGVDRDLDLAVITVSTGERPAIAWDPAALGELGVGSVVFALANPGGRGAACAARSSTPRRCPGAPRAAPSWTWRAGCSA